MGVDVIQLQGVTKHFTVRKQKSLKESVVNARRGKLHEERFTALNDISATIQAGESVGLIGPNGSGKSTLLKVIGGILAPDTGSVRMRGRVAALLELGAGFHPDLSGRENVYLNASVLGLTRQETAGYFDEIVDFSGIGEFIDTQVKFYSSGMYVRLAFSVAVHVDPDILLVDEVMAVGDEPFQAKCMRKIQQFQEEGRTIILVSHSVAQITEVCDRALLLEHGHLVEDAPPLVALERLRRGYSAEIETTSRVALESLSHASLNAVHLSVMGGPQGVSPLELASGDGLEVKLVLGLPEPVKGMHLKIGIDNALGEHVLTVDTWNQLHLDIGTHSGLVTVRFSLPNLCLTSGDYHVRVFVTDKDGGILARSNRAGTFSVQASGRSAGYVDSDVKFSVDETRPL